MPAVVAETRRVIAFDVLGTPAPKGSMRAVLIRGKARLLPGGSDANRKAQRAWEKAIVEAARLAIGDPPPYFDKALPFHAKAALYVSMVFYVRRPKAAKHRPRPNTRADADKLARLVGDALEGVLWQDDGRIVDLVVSKRWAEPGCEGARITVTEARAM